MIFSRSLSLISFALAAAASQVVLDGILSNSGSKPEDLDFEALYRAFPDYSVDLNAKRVIQFSPSDPPVELSELEKVSSDEDHLHLLSSAKSSYRFN